MDRMFRIRSVPIYISLIPRLFKKKLENENKNDRGMPYGNVRSDSNIYTMFTSRHAAAGRTRHFDQVINPSSSPSVFILIVSPLVYHSRSAFVLVQPSLSTRRVPGRPPLHKTRRLSIFWHQRVSFRHTLSDTYIC